MARIPVWFYGDYGCPFSYLVEHRLALLARERALDVRWRPLALYPGARRRRGAGVGTAGGTGAGDEESLRDELRRAAAELGLPLHLPAPGTDTRDPLQAAEFARDVGPPHFLRLHRALFRALLGEGRDIGSRPVLLEIAGEAGVDGDALERALEDGRYEPELEAARGEAARYGIEATPALLFGRFLLIGSAPLPELRRAADLAGREGVPSR